MNVSHLLTMTATVERVVADGGQDVFGDATTSATTETFRCWMQQAGADEDTNGRDGQREDFTLFVEPAAAGRIDGTDRVTVGGTTFEVVGPPWSATNARTAVCEYVLAKLRRVV